MPMLNRATVVDPYHGEIYFWACTEPEVRRLATEYVAKATPALDGYRPHFKEVRKVCVPTTRHALVDWLNRQQRKQPTPDAKGGAS